jgi:hypothetical protein
MSPVSRATAALLALPLVIAAGGASSKATPLATARTGLPASAVVPVEKFLGFEIGEQRRYLLGPPEALDAGERGRWAITLDTVYATGAGSHEAVFQLASEWHGARLLETPLDMITDVESHGRVQVNASGFPLAIEYETERHLAGGRSETYMIVYRYDDGRYRKHTTMDGGQRDDEVPVRGSELLELDVPSGLYPFLPEPPGCPGLRASIDDGRAHVNEPERRAVAAPSSGRLAPNAPRIVDSYECKEPLFANPGLLSFVMPALWEAKGARELLFFTPLGPTGEMAGTLTVGLGAPGAGAPGLAGGSPGNSDRPAADASDFHFITPARYRQRERLAFGERVRVRIGDRTRDAWVLTGASHVGDIYVDDQGVVLRIDLPKPTADASERWIRLLWPSEF